MTIRGHVFTPLDIRFWSKVDKRGDNECWAWLGATASGRPTLWFDGRNVPAGRIALLLDGQDVPAGMCACHKCDNPPCVNPKHLFIGTLGDNNRDRSAKGRSVQGEMSPSSKLSSSSVTMIRRHYNYLQRGTKRVFLGLLAVSYATANNIVNGKTWRGNDPA